MPWQYSALSKIIKYDASIPLFKEVIDRSPRSFSTYIAYKALTAAYELAGRHAEARWAAENVLRMNPKFTLEREPGFSRSGAGRFKDRIMNAYSSAGPKRSPMP
jgi:tetratricopeptide (TPR) repeat protein